MASRQRPAGQAKTKGFLLKAPDTAHLMLSHAKKDSFLKAPSTDIARPWPQHRALRPGAQQGISAGLRRPVKARLRLVHPDTSHAMRKAWLRLGHGAPAVIPAKKDSFFEDSEHRLRSPAAPHTARFDRAPNGASRRTVAPCKGASPAGSPPLTQSSRNSPTTSATESHTETTCHGEPATPQPKKCFLFSKAPTPPVRHG